MFFPRQESAIHTGDLQDDCEKVELEVPSYAPEGGGSVPHSNNKDHTKEIKPDICDSPSSKDHHTSYSYTIACNRPHRTIRKPACYSVDDEDGLIAYALTVAQEIPKSIEPSTYSEAISCPNSSDWLLAM